ncbi:leukocyte immunoglobulin-like receptor subfamily A member 2 [Melozone crissalis]|uniref:leukocyte immunoglobulin-like receptor subfamily A member 2 n=1 Tax=Melozone crissalis TaxID=40204 RepID=UPI0023DB07AE|nr:leukocyte immunoglobulin-like receptor subfamily A member 2 [Melozone crissalis]
MLPVTHVLALGAWLVSLGEATPSAPTISIFQKPPGVIPPGGSTTIYCICQCSSGSFRMYKGGHQLPTLEQSGGRAEFSISNATYEDTGNYVCHYLEGDTELVRDVLFPLLWGHAPGHTRMPVAISMMDKVFLLFPGLERWGPSSPLPEAVGGFTEILVLLAPRQSPLHLLIPSPVPPELRLPRPDLSVLPGHEVDVGAEVMFRCTTTQPSTGCYLYLEGQMKVLLFLREQGNHNFSLVQKGHSGRYSCQCMNGLKEWSAVSNTLDLVVRGETSPQPHPAPLFLPAICHILGELERV